MLEKDINMECAKMSKELEVLVEMLDSYLNNCTLVLLHINRTNTLELCHILKFSDNKLCVYIESPSGRSWNMVNDIKIIDTCCFTSKYGYK